MGFILDDGRPVWPGGAVLLRPLCGPVDHQACAYFVVAGEFPSGHALCQIVRNHGPRGPRCPWTFCSTGGGRKNINDTWYHVLAIMPPSPRQVLRYSSRANAYRACTKLSSSRRVDGPDLDFQRARLVGCRERTDQFISQNPHTAIMGDSSHWWRLPSPILTIP